MAMEGYNTNGEEDNLREEDCRERMGGKINITIKMSANRDGDFKGKPKRSLKRGRDIDYKEDMQEEGKDSNEEDEKQGSGENNE